MCGRYTLFTAGDRLEERFDARLAMDYRPRYNLAPTQTTPVVTSDAPDELRGLRWGLIPSWADDDSTSFINARAETAREKRSFREPFERRRCLVPADGFYEWTDTESGRQPYRVAYEDDRPFALAGLYERWEPPQVQTGLGEFGAGGADDDGDDAIESFTILTTEPNEVVAPLHHRMAVILRPDAEETWLHGDPDEAAAVLEVPDADGMVAYPVSTRVNSPENDDPSLIEEVST